MTRAEEIIWRTARELLRIDLYMKDEEIRREYARRTVYDRDMTTVSARDELVFITWFEGGRERRMTFEWPQYISEVRRIGRENALELSEAEA